MELSGGIACRMTWKGDRIRMAHNLPNLTHFKPSQ